MVVHIFNTNILEAKEGSCKISQLQASWATQWHHLQSKQEVGRWVISSSHAGCRSSFKESMGWEQEAAGRVCWLSGLGRNSSVSPFLQTKTQVDGITAHLDWVFPTQTLPYLNPSRNILTLSKRDKIQRCLWRRWSNLKHQSQCSMI